MHRRTCGSPTASLATPPAREALCAPRCPTGSSPASRRCAVCRWRTRRPRRRRPPSVPQPAPHQRRPLRATASALIITLPPTGSRRAHVLHHAGAHDRPRRRARRREAALRFTCSSSPRTRRVTPRRVISRRQELRAEGDRGVLDEREGRRLAGHAQAAPVQDPRPKHQLARPLRGVLRKAAPTPRRRNLAAGRRHGRAAPAAARARREAQAPSRAGARRGRRRQAQASAGLRRRISATGLTRRRTALREGMSRERRGR